jgi:heptosyltransferase-2
MKILVIQQKMIGDVLTSSIICENLKKYFPESTVDYVINSHTLPVVKNNPTIDNFIFFSPEYRKNKRSFLLFLLDIKHQKYDIVIDAYGKLESLLMSLFSFSKTKISYKKWYTQFLYSKTIERGKIRKYGFAIDDRLELLKSILPIDANPIVTPRIYLLEEEIKKGKFFLEENKITVAEKIVMISILGSSENKTLPLPFMAEVINNIAESKIDIILFNYMPSQLKEAEELLHLCSEFARKKIRFDIYAKSLRDFIVLLSFCEALIGNEGGTVNMAKAIGIPTYSIFAPQISKDNWDLFSSENNISVHLKDFRPDLFADNLAEKKIKKKSLLLYQKFEPDFIKKSLDKFLIHLKLLN